MATENKASMLDKMNVELKNKNVKIKELEKLLAISNKKVIGLEKEATMYSTDENKIKKVLELKAQGHQYSVILDKMRYSSFEDVNIEEIRNICLNVDELKPDLQLYYKQQVEAFEESIKINPELIKDVLAKRYEFLYNEASIDLVNAQEVEERRRIRVEMKDHMKELNNVLKNIVDDNKELPENEFLSKIANRLMNSNDKDVGSYSEKESIEAYEVI